MSYHASIKLHDQKDDLEKENSVMDKKKSGKKSK